MMRNNIIKRCPWCGSEVEKLGLRTQTIKKCPECGKKYTYGGSGFGDSNAEKYIKIALLVFSVFCLYLSVYCKIFLVVMILSLIAVFTLNLNKINYQRYDDPDMFKYKKYISAIRFAQDYTEKEIKILLSNCSIFPICFIDDNRQAISNDICIFVEEANKLPDNSYECIFSFLPLSETKYNINEFNFKFICYDNRKIIGEGIVLRESTKF